MRTLGSRNRSSTGPTLLGMAPKETGVTRGGRSRSGVITGPTAVIVILVRGVAGLETSSASRSVLEAAAPTGILKKSIS